jgi:hypothetical protein
LPAGTRSPQTGLITSPSYSSMIKLRCRKANYGDDTGHCTCMHRQRRTYSR